LIVKLGRKRSTHSLDGDERARLPARSAPAIARIATGESSNIRRAETLDALARADIKIWREP
jgi:hypothetical protein